MKSTNGGATWNKIYDFATKIYADPSNSNRVLIQGSGGTVRYSGNGGDTFTTVTQLAMPPYTNGVLHVSGVNWNSNSIVVATNFGLREFNPNASPLRFYNRGNTGIFSHVNGDPTIGNSIATFSSVTLPPVNGRYSARFYAVTYPTTNGWQLSYPRLPTIPNHDPNQVKVYKMDWVQGSAATNWQPNAQWVLINRNQYGFDLIPYWVKTSASNSNVVYLAGVDGTPYDRPSVVRSENGGNTWYQVFKTDDSSTVNTNITSGWIASGATPNPSLVGGIDWGWTPNIEGIAVDPNDAKRVIITTAAVHTTENASSGNWTQAYTKPDSPNPPNVAIPQHKSSKRYSSNGIEPTMTYWLTWSGKKMVTAMTDIFGMFSDNNGRSWRNIGNDITLANRPDGNPKVAHLNNYKITKSKLSGTRLYSGMATFNDIYQSHNRLTDFEQRFSNNPPGTTCFSSNRDGAIGSIHKSNDSGGTWQPIKWFKCPVVWVETALEKVNGAETEVVYASVVHSIHGGIFKITNPNSSNVIVTRIPSRPPGTQGNPNNIHAYRNPATGQTELLTTWAVKISNNNDFTGSGLFKYVVATNTWETFNHPIAMNKRTKNLTINPKDSSIWYVSAFNKYSRYKTPSSNSIANGGGGIFKYTGNGSNWSRITPSGMYRPENIAINPESYSNEAYVTTASDGIWRTNDVTVNSPIWNRVSDFPYSRALRVFYAPDKSVWASTFGGGLFKLDDDRSKLGTIVTIPAGTGSASPITDNSFNPQTHWSNGGNANKRSIELNLQERHSITSIVYADVWNRQLKVSIFDGSGAAKVVFNTSTNPRVGGISYTDIPVDNVLGDRIKIEVTNGSYMQTVEAEVHGVMVEADFASVTTNPVLNQGRIDNGEQTQSWSNGGVPQNASIGIALDEKRTIFNIKYRDSYRRNLRLKFYDEGKLIHQLDKQTNNSGGTLSTTDITVPHIPAKFVSIQVLNPQNQAVRWMTPTEIDIFGWPE